MLSIWEKQSFFAPADILIGGGGFTGLWSAWWLKKKHPKLHVTIVDRGTIPTGASTRNAGFACFGSVTELMHDVMLFGEDETLELTEKRYKGIERIRKTFSRKSLGFEACGGYEPILSLDANRYNELRHQISWLNKKLKTVTGKKETFHFASEQLPKVGLSHFDQLIHTPCEAALHPGKLCQALLKAVQSMGVTLLTGMEIKEYEVHEDMVALTTDKGIDLKAKQLLICTNGFAKQLLPELDVIPARGQILVTSPIENLRLKGTFHFDMGYYYFRNLGNRVLLGGARNMAIEDETTYELKTSADVQTALESFLSRHILEGQQYEITDRWSGIMGSGPEKKPVIRKISPRVYCAVRMSGMGVALAPMVGESIMRMMTE